MEEVKHAVAYKMCRDSGRPVEDVYGKIVSIASDARRCYDADDAKVKALSDAEFATMMFLDGCFLLWYMPLGVDNNDDRLLRGFAISAGPSILRDMFMLENQIPWLVLEVLMEFWPVVADSVVYDEVVGAFLHVKQEKTNDDPLLWIKRCAQRLLQAFLDKCGADGHVPEEKSDGETSINIRRGNFKPPHLLGLMRYILIHGISSSSLDEGRGSGDDRERSPPLTMIRISAVDLAQKGVKATGSTAEWFADMKVNKKLVFGELSLSPMCMDDVYACYLVNLAALEAAGASTTSSFVPDGGDGNVVSSYLSVLAMLMDSEEDVHELRRKGVLCSHFSDAQTLAFFKGFGQHLRLGNNYFRILRDIPEYMHRRRVRIAFHKFAAVLSIAGVLVGIFKAIYSFKQQQP